MSFKMTKIIATLGPASGNKKTIDALVRAGVNIFRLNMSHGNYPDLKKWIRFIRAVEIQQKTAIGILIDLQGPKIRVGKFQNGFIHLNPDDTLTFTTRNVTGSAKLVPIQLAGFSKSVKPGDLVYLNDGSLCVKVKSITGNDVKVQVMVGGVLSDFKGVNLPDAELTTSPITAKDRQDLRFGLNEGVDFVGLSFVGSPNDIHKLRRLIHKAGGDANIIAKIERKVAVKRYREIIEAADGVMVARGDLGIEIPLTQVPVAQQKILWECATQQKPAIVATQMLESMVENNRPTRAEVSDISTAVMGGADAVMLSAETATGKYPVDAVRMMAATAREMEAYQKTHRRILPWQRFFKEDPPVSQGIAYSANRLVELLGGRALMVYTKTGGTAMQVASPKPNVPIFTFTSVRECARHMALIRGTVPILIKSERGFLGDITPFFKKIKETRLLKKGDRIILTTGIPLGVPQWTNVIRVEEMP